MNLPLLGRALFLGFMVPYPRCPASLQVLRMELTSDELRPPIVSPKMNFLPLRSFLSGLLVTAAKKLRQAVDRMWHSWSNPLVPLQADAQDLLSTWHTLIPCTVASVCPQTWPCDSVLAACYDSRALNNHEQRTPASTSPSQRRQPARPPGPHKRSTAACPHLLEEEPRRGAACTLSSARRSEH